VIGICGGMQMLGTWIHDPKGIEGSAGSSEGLGLLELETTLEPHKQLRNVGGTLVYGNTPFTGYEIHMGVSRGAALARPATMIDGEPEGAVSADGRILATYVHGIFDSPQACAALLQWAGHEGARGIDVGALREASLERLADCVEACLDMNAIRSCLA
jgi:adenosylcobyric acid synthase